ncbi:alpha/beta fold hydrolase [Acidisoma silvae]|uniref:alpha/beta fold hydrolase n=1 Tax=Acidisoma silvae TaxID=2802396 RepID=UPI001D0B65D2|nr:alpha/beta fold hydrolase [Acidisoma silvae]
MNSAWPSWNAGWPQTAPASAAPLAQIAARVAAAGPGAEASFAETILRQVWAQDRAFLAGIARYRRHSYQRNVAEPPCLWQEGNSRLLDYAPDSTDPVVLVVPSLVNRAYVLDLKPQTSLLRFLAGAGLRPLLLDWGDPGAVEKSFTLTDYIAGRLERAITAIGKPVILAGYCMGGLLTLGAALRRPEAVRGLALLATPWDFHAEDAARAQSLARLLPALEPAMHVTGTLPTDLLQMLFTCLSPFETPAKYRAFAKLDEAGASAERFVALEDWLNDGVPLAAPVARTCLGEWYGENRTAIGLWTVAGAPVVPETLNVPSFVAIPNKDRIVPPASALALANALPGAVIHRPAAGHIGMVAGRRAEAELWRPLRDWCLTL